MCISTCKAFGVVSNDGAEINRFTWNLTAIWAVAILAFGFHRKVDRTAFIAEVDDAFDVQDCQSTANQ